MPYKPLQRAYYVANEFLKSIFERKPKGYTLALGIEGPETVFIKNPSVAAALFLKIFEYYKERSVRITPENFNKFFPPPAPEQLELDLEKRL